MHMQLPSLYCPFPEAINPYAAVVDRQVIDWVRRWSTPDAPSYNDLPALHLGRLAARTHPTASYEALQLVADWCAWLFLHDDFCDESQFSRQPDRLAAWHEQLLTIMDDTPARTPETGLIAGFTDLWRRTTSTAPQSWTARFRASVGSFFAASTWEATNRRQGQAPDVSTYMLQRPFTSGMYMYIDLIDAVYDFALPPVILAHLQHLREHTARAACWVNDIVSCPKELARGDQHNLVIALMAHGEMAPADAVLQAAAIHDREVRAFLIAEAQLPVWDDATHSEVRRYCSILRAYMRGNLDWTTQAVRYRVAAASVVAQPADQVRMVGY
jgi:5-epi-alpha-selinene synthase